MSHLEETIRRIKKWFKEGKKEEPTKVDIFFTERCNLKCKFCNYSKTPLHLNQEMDDKKRPPAEAGCFYGCIQLICHAAKGRIDKQDGTGSGYQQNPCR